MLTKTSQLTSHFRHQINPSVSPMFVTSSHLNRRTQPLTDRQTDRQRTNSVKHLANIVINMACRRQQTRHHLASWCKNWHNSTILLVHSPEQTGTSLELTLCNTHTRSTVTAAAAATTTNYFYYYFNYYNYCQLWVLLSVL